MRGNLREESGRREAEEEEPNKVLKFAFDFKLFILLSLTRAAAMYAGLRTHVHSQLHDCGKGRFSFEDKGIFRLKGCHDKPSYSALSKA